jgi:hypothetical protein
MKGVCLLSEISRIPTDVEAIGLSSTLAFECTGTTVPVPVKRHRGEPGHTRDTRDTRDTRAHAGKRITRTNLTTIHPNPKTQTRTKTATDSTAARTAASPESTAPRKPVQVPVLYCTGTVPVLYRCCTCCPMPTRLADAHGMLDADEQTPTTWLHSYPKSHETLNRHVGRPTT